MRIACKTCGEFFDRPQQRGRPTVRCEKCRTNNVQDALHEKVKALVEAKVGTTEVPVAEEKETIKKSYSKYDENFPYPFRVVVGNLGLAFGGNDEKESEKAYEHYVKCSNEGFGQVGFQYVQLWKLNVALNQYEVLQSFIPDRSQ